MKKKGNVDKPAVKNMFKKALKPVKTASILIGIAALGFTGANVIREVKESLDGSNPIIELDLGSTGYIIVKNNDTRTAIEIYANQVQAALSVEGLEHAYNNGDSMSIKEKEAFLKKFIIEVSKSAGINIDKVLFVDKSELGIANGSYVGYNYKQHIIYSRNTVRVNNTLLDSNSLARAIEVAFHEVIHATESINIQTNKKVDNFDPSIINAWFRYGSKDFYFSNFHEITAIIITNQFRIGLDEKYSNSNINFEYYNNHISLLNMVSQMVENDMVFHNRTSDYYNDLTIGEIINLGIKNHYEYLGKEITTDDLYKTYTYDLIRYGIPEKYMNVNYHDFIFGYDQFDNWNLQVETTKLETYIQNFKDANYYPLLSGVPIDDFSTDFNYLKNLAEQQLAQQMAKVMSVVRYDANDYNLNDIENSYELIISNLHLLKKSSVEFYRLDKENGLNFLIADTVQKTNYIEIDDQDYELQI